MSFVRGGDSRFAPVQLVKPQTESVATKKPGKSHTVKDQVNPHSVVVDFRDGIRSQPKSSRSRTVCGTVGTALAVMQDQDPEFGKLPLADRMRLLSAKTRTVGVITEPLTSRMASAAVYAGTLSLINSFRSVKTGNGAIRAGSTVYLATLTEDDELDGPFPLTTDAPTASDPAFASALKQLYSGGTCPAKCLPVRFLQSAMRKTVSILSNMNPEQMKLEHIVHAVVVAGKFQASIVLNELEWAANQMKKREDKDARLVRPAVADTANLAADAAADVPMSVSELLSGMHQYGTAGRALHEFGATGGKIFPGLAVHQNLLWLESVAREKIVTSETPFQKPDSRKLISILVKDGKVAISAPQDTVKSNPVEFTFNYKSNVLSTQFPVIAFSILMALCKQSRYVQGSSETAHMDALRSAASRSDVQHLIALCSSLGSRCYTYADGGMGVRFFDSLAGGPVYAALQASAFGEELKELQAAFAKNPDAASRVAQLTAALTGIPVQDVHTVTSTTFDLGAADANFTALAAYATPTCDLPVSNPTSVRATVRPGDAIGIIMQIGQMADRLHELFDGRSSAKAFNYDVAEIEHALTGELTEELISAASNTRVGTVQYRTDQGVVIQVDI